MVTSEVSKNLQISKLEFQVGRTVLHTVVMSRIYRYTQYRYRLGLYAARTPPPRLFRWFMVHSFQLARGMTP